MRGWAEDFEQDVVFAGSVAPAQSAAPDGVPRLRPGRRGWRRSRSSSLATSRRRPACRWCPRRRGARGEDTSPLPDPFACGSRARGRVTCGAGPPATPTRCTRSRPAGSSPRLGAPRAGDRRLRKTRRRGGDGSRPARGAGVPRERRPRGTHGRLGQPGRARSGSRRSWPRPARTGGGCRVHVEQSGSDGSRAPRHAGGTREPSRLAGAPSAGRPAVRRRRGAGRRPRAT